MAVLDFDPPVPDLAPLVEPKSAPPSSQPELSTPVRVFTDGSILKNPGGEGGWAFVAVQGSALLEVRSGGVPVSTNNRMELTAVIEAMKWATARPGVEILSDSQYVTKGLNDYMPSWRAREFHKVKNLDLWEQLDILFMRDHMKITWIKGHIGFKYNELADKLAGEAARLVRDHA